VVLLVSDPSLTVWGSRLDLPNQVTAQMEIQAFTVAMVRNLVLYLRTCDGLIARYAYVPRSVTRARSSGTHVREPTVLDALTDAQP
jgi:hypothetical protein